MRRLVTMIAIAGLLATGPAHAFDANGADIVGLRLGMSEHDVVAHLGHQGFTMNVAPESIAARTLDGHLRVAFTPGRGATEISYVFDWGGDVVATRLRESIVTHYGEPVRATPMTWCLAAGSDGKCPDDQASLTFVPESSTLTLRAQADGHKWARTP